MKGGFIVSLRLAPRSVFELVSSLESSSSCFSFSLRRSYYYFFLFLSSCLKYFDTVRNFNIGVRRIRSVGEDDGIRRCVVHIFKMRFLFSV